VVNDETRRQYLNLAAAVNALFKSLLPDAAGFEFSPICNVFKVVAEKIRSELPVVDISAVMADVEALLNKSIAVDGYVMPPVSNDPSRYIDLCQIDFEALTGALLRTDSAKIVVRRWSPHLRKKSDWKRISLPDWARSFTLVGRLIAESSRSIVFFFFRVTEGELADSTLRRLSAVSSFGTT
jgi:hypothetical protein